ncbi:nuclear receptor coactivator 4 isoform X1 [Lates japonicus]|uniref:Nuclear receptor coactivator 4 isoform X1 n=1 Tax=Lates japonicus TaxID=270547 RepID=A0AAD3MMD0_LATJO|nr:nuclear receptor coactivator 4 isoform X1 [Lates japonicus]
MTSKSRVHSRGTRMPSSAAEAAGGLKQCQQAQGQLEDAINAVMKAEQQLRENAREVFVQTDPRPDPPLLTHCSSPCLWVRRRRGGAERLAHHSPPTTAMETCLTLERWRQTSWAKEIENLASSQCLKTSPASSPASSPAPPLAATALEAWLQQVVPVQQTCRANEPCSSYADCVSPPTLYHREQEQKVQAILEAWLHPNTSSCRTLSSSLSAWVAPEEEKASREDHSSQFKPPFSCSPFQRPLDPDLWVIPAKTLTPAPGSGGQPRPAEEEDKWLLKKRSQAQERLVLPVVCDLFSCMKVGGDKEKWLHKAPVQM